MIAGASMMLSSFTVILNALRLKRWRMKKWVYLIKRRK
jgi:cation transport ATPase